jgi:hypothetical protein
VGKEWIAALDVIAWGKKEKRKKRCYPKRDLLGKEWIAALDVIAWGKKEKRKKRCYPKRDLVGKEWIAALDEIAWGKKEKEKSAAIHYLGKFQKRTDRLVSKETKHRRKRDLLTQK